MENKQTFVNSYAAAAIILMNAAPYYARASVLLTEFRAKRVYLTVGSFHPLVAEEASAIVEKIEARKMAP
jgi:hypothetical protein